MHRRILLRMLCTLVAIVTGMTGMGSSTLSAAETATLRDQLEKGLKARLPDEFAFIDTVVTMVDNGTLPEELVDKIFFYVRKTRGHRKYLVPYFERLLRLKAAEMGIAIP